MITQLHENILNTNNSIFNSMIYNGNTELKLRKLNLIIIYRNIVDLVLALKYIAR